MQSARGALLSACVLLLTSPMAGAQQAAAPETASMAEVVVEGHHEGPRMWRVRRDDHVLWILGTVSPLPKKMVWQPGAVQEVLKESQEVVPAWPTYGIGANPITALRLYIQWRRMQQPPTKCRCSRWCRRRCTRGSRYSRRHYDPRDKSLERERPMLAAERLLEKVLEGSGLTARNEVQATVLRLARAQGVRVRQDKLRIDDPLDVLKDVGATPLAAEVACLDAVVTRLETDLGPMQARARAWALGDVATLRNLPHTDSHTACVTAVSTSERVRTIVQRAEEDWLVAVQDSLARNRGTLAVQSMDRLLGEHGALAALKARGYDVAGP